MVVAVGIIQFRHIPRWLAHLPQELVSHTSHHRSFGTFSRRDVTVIGGGQSALETAALAREQGANVRVFVRQPRLVWNDDVPQEEPRPLAQRLRRPMTGLGDGWRLRFYADSPGRFHRLPERMRVRGEDGLGPAGAWWLRERVLGQLPVLTGHTVVGAEADGQPSAPAGEARRRTGDRPDHRAPDRRDRLPGGPWRLPFLGDQLRGRLRLMAGAPAPSSSFEASAPELYFIGLASAYSFGPVMRFLDRVNYNARRLVGHLLAKAAAAPSLAPAVPG